MVILLEREPSAFDPEKFPEWVWVSSLFGRLTHNLVLRDELKRAYEIVEREMQVVADIQRSLLPQELPAIPGLELGGALPDLAVGRRRLLRLLPAARRAVGHPDRGRQRPRDARGRDDGDHAQPGPRPARAPGAAGRAPGARQPAVVPPVLGRQRGVRHGVLRHLRPGGADPVLRLRRPQSAAAEAVRRDGRPLARRDRRAAAGALRRDRIRPDDRGAPGRRYPGLLYRRHHRGHGPPRRPVRHRRGSTRSSAAATSTRRGSSAPSSRPSTPSPAAIPPRTTAPCWWPSSADRPRPRARTATTSHPPGPWLAQPA